MTRRLRRLPSAKIFAAFALSSEGVTKQNHLNSLGQGKFSVKLIPFQRAQRRVSSLNLTTLKLWSLHLWWIALMWLKQCHKPQKWLGMVNIPSIDGDDWGDGKHGIVLPTFFHYLWRLTNLIRPIWSAALSLGMPGERHQQRSHHPTRLQTLPLGCGSYGSYRCRWPRVTRVTRVHRLVEMVYPGSIPSFYGIFIGNMMMNHMNIAKTWMNLSTWTHFGVSPRWISQHASTSLFLVGAVGAVASGHAEMSTSWDFLDEICRFSQPGWPRKSEIPGRRHAMGGGWAMVGRGEMGSWCTTFGRWWRLVAGR